MKNKSGWPTIGILTGWSAYVGETPDRYIETVLSGIRAAARQRKCNLLLGWSTGNVSGTGDPRLAWPEVSSRSDFVPVGPWNTDGLIVFAPLRTESRMQYIQTLRQEGRPVLFIATGEEGPSVSVSNEIGIRQAVAHLAEHGHRDIAYLSGDPLDTGDSLSRLRAFKASVLEFNLNSDPGLILTGHHNLHRSYLAMQSALVEGIRFTGLLASDDISAIGAMRALQEAGLHIPRDIAVIGFDDQPDATAQVPPLSSVHVPLVEIGQQALEMMLDHIERQSPLTSVKVPTWLVTRQSCGCFLDVMFSAGGQVTLPAAQSPPPGETDGKRAQWTQEAMVSAMAEAVLRDKPAADAENYRLLCTQITQSFFRSVDESDRSSFIYALMALLQEIERSDDDAHGWQDVFAILRRNMTRLLRKWTPGQLDFADDLLDQARIGISESARRADDRHRYHENNSDHLLGLLTARLGVSLDERQAVAILDEYLPILGMHPCRIMRFEAEEDDPVAWSQVIGSKRNPSTHRFPSRQFPPPGLYPGDEPFSLALLPIVFQDEAIGYAAFDIAVIKQGVAITQQLAATFKVTRLHQRVVELSLTDSLTGLYNRRYLDHFLAGEVERCRRYKRELSLIMIDLDKFKEYNDTYGHVAGDEALKVISACIKNNCRKSDVVMRYGGDEFAVILSETDAEHARVIAARIREAVAGLTNLKRAFTISMGIAALAGAGFHVDGLIKHADQALYDAKRRGRNQIRVSKKRRR